jgi:hypothetical protein
MSNERDETSLIKLIYRVNNLNECSKRQAGLSFIYLIHFIRIFSILLEFQKLVRSIVVPLRSFQILSSLYHKIVKASHCLKNSVSSSHISDDI